MIIFNISGGLGNQFFQYAFGRYLAVTNNQQLYLRFEDYKEDPSRRPVLEYFNTHYQECQELQEQKVLRYRKQYETLHPFLKKHYRRSNMVKFKRYFNDKKDPCYHNELLNASHGYFDGYWSHERYFSGIKDLVKHELELKPECKNETYHSVVKDITKSNSVAIHIRRGDYTQVKAFSDRFGILSLEYYKAAINFINDKVENPVFFIFTDDLQWVKEHFLIQDLNYQFVIGQGINHDYVQFSIMQHCYHYIIANSTFSWWAAWLGLQKDSIVVAPENWYNDPDWQRLYESNKFIPNDWIMLK